MKEVMDLILLFDVGNTNITIGLSDGTHVDQTTF